VDRENKAYSFELISNLQLALATRGFQQSSEYTANKKEI
jgi:hypothetical protein